MTAAHAPTSRDLRISADEILARLRSGVPMTLLDVRNDRPWETSNVKARSAIRIRPADWQISPAWPKDQLTVVY